MRLVRPYQNERKEIIFVEFENETVEGLVNGALLALVVFGPISLFLPPLI